MFTWKPHRNLTSLVFHSVPSRIQELQRNYRHRRGLYRFCARGQQRCLSREGLREPCRNANAQQKLWTGRHQVKARALSIWPTVNICKMQTRDCHRSAPVNSGPDQYQSAVQHLDTHCQPRTLRTLPHRRRVHA